jgi:CubicO group peptidase (beta-lactamase class C family)
MSHAIHPAIDSDMTSGLAWDEPGNYGFGNVEFPLYWRSSEARHVLERPMAHPAGQRFSYNGGSTAILAELLAKGVGMPLPDYARSRLFAPLGITDWEWLRDLARIGQLILQGGSWNGVQIVPEAWIAASLQPGPRSATGAGMDINGGTAKPGPLEPHRHGRPDSAMAASACSWCPHWTWSSSGSLLLELS